MVSEFDWTGWAQLAQKGPETGLRGPHSALRRERPVGNPLHLQCLRPFIAGMRRKEKDMFYVRRGTDKRRTPHSNYSILLQ